MSKRRSYEEKLLDDLMAIKPNRWFNIYGRPEYEKMVAAIKKFIDNSHPFIFSNDYKKIKLESFEWVQPMYHEMKELPEGITMEHITRGTEDIISMPNGKVAHVTLPEHYIIRFNEKIIAIES